MSSVLLIFFQTFSPRPAALPVVQVVPVILRTDPGGGYRPPAAGAGEPGKSRKNKKDSIKRLTIKRL
jgi:hypothetical protein